MRFVICLAAITLVALGNPVTPSEARANIIYSTFNPAGGSGFNSSQAYFIQPQQHGPAVGMEFTPTITGTVASYDFAFANLASGYPGIPFQLLDEFSNAPS